MSDVVAAALIAGLVGLLGSAATLIVTRWNMAEQTRERKLARDDAARQMRLDYYARLSDQLGRLQKYGGLGFPPSKDDWTDWLDRIVWSAGLVMLVGSRSVKEAVNEFTRVLHEAASDLRQALPDGETGLAPANGWIDAYDRHRERLDAARLRLMAEMSASVALA